MFKPFILNHCSSGSCGVIQQFRASLWSVKEVNGVYKIGRLV